MLHRLKILEGTHKKEEGMHADCLHLFYKDSLVIQKQYNLV